MLPNQRDCTIRAHQIKGVLLVKPGRPNDRQKTLHNQGYIPRKCCRPQCLRRWAAPQEDLKPTPAAEPEPG